MIDIELERFKTEINLVELASSYGYSIIRKDSSRSSVAMSHPDGDKVVIATNKKNGHGIFFCVLAGASGTIVDFVQWREGGKDQCNIGKAKKILRPCLAPGYLQSRSKVHYRPVPTDDINSSNLLANWLGYREYGGGYLESRGLTTETIAAFADRIRLDHRNNVCFRHGDQHSLTGWEVKNRGFTGFCAGGKKALFGCQIGTLDNLIICESAIDAMSYYQIKHKQGFYFSFAGGLSNEQIELLRWVIGKYPDARVAAATDADDQGDKYAAIIGSMRDGVRREKPVRKDWNDVLTGGCRLLFVG